MNFNLTNALNISFLKAVNILLLSFLFIQQANADIYVYIDSKGNQHFSQRKVNEQYKLLLRSDSNKSNGSFKNWKNKSYSNISLPSNKTLQKKYHALIVEAARKYELEPAFIHAVITAESNYQHKAISRAGAKGLMQLMPVTAKRFGVDDPYNAKQSINAGTKYLAKLLHEFKNKKLALAAYNAGEGTIRRYNKKIPPYPETQQYVRKVMKFYRHYKLNL